MRKRKPQWDEAACRPGSPEQQLDMCEQGTLRGEESLREFHGIDRIESEMKPDMAEEDREGDEMSGDEHSSGFQGGDSELESQPVENGMPGDATRVEEQRALDRLKKGRAA